MMTEREKREFMALPAAERRRRIESLRVELFRRLAERRKTNQAYRQTVYLN